MRLQIDLTLSKNSLCPFEWLNLLRMIRIIHIDMIDLICSMYKAISCCFVYLSADISDTLSVLISIQFASRT